MIRAIAAATLSLTIAGAVAGQDAAVLHIKVSLLDTEHKTVPVSRHALLISDNPATATPRRVVTAADGTANVQLRPGNYTVESDEPLLFHGQAIHWTQTLDVAAGRETILELTADNAEFEAVTSATTPTASTEVDPSAILMPRQDSVVALWTPTAHASAFVIDSRGLLATSQHAIGTVTSVEVQLAPAVKVAGGVLVSDPARDVAIVHIDPAALASTPTMPLGCGRQRKPLAEGDTIFTIEAPLREPRSISRGRVSRVEPRAIVSDLVLADGSAGGPVFAADGELVGITSLAESHAADRRRGDARVVAVDGACEVLASAEKALKDAVPPRATRLPVEPAQEYSQDELKAVAQRRVGSLSPYRMSSSDFDIAFITPVMLYGAQSQVQRSGGRTERSTIGPQAVRPLEDFSNWSEYVADVPPVLLVRVTPKQVEGFWTTVARGAAQTQGLALPPIKHFKSGFSRMRALCGTAEVTPIHPFKLEQRVSESDAIYEGLYVYDPEALGRNCGTVTLWLYSEKTPDKGDARVVDATLLQQLWRDFSEYLTRK
jgi:S1-C subfamily serine protease